MAPGTLAFRRETGGRKDTGGETGDETGVRRKKGEKGTGGEASGCCLVYAENRDHRVIFRLAHAIFICYYY
jgi:hypothetical protein